MGFLAALLLLIVSYAGALPGGVPFPRSAYSVSMSAVSISERTISMSLANGFLVRLIDSNGETHLAAVTSRHAVEGFEYVIVRRTAGSGDEEELALEARIDLEPGALILLDDESIDVAAVLMDEAEALTVDLPDEDGIPALDPGLIAPRAALREGQPVTMAVYETDELLDCRFVPPVELGGSIASLPDSTTAVYLDCEARRGYSGCPVFTGGDRSQEGRLAGMVVARITFRRRSELNTSWERSDFLLFELGPTMAELEPADHILLLLEAVREALP